MQKESFKFIIENAKETASSATCWHDFSGHFFKSKELTAFKDGFEKGAEFSFELFKNQIETLQKEIFFLKNQDERTFSNEYISRI
jgi:hypothetical protein